MSCKRLYNILLGWYLILHHITAIAYYIKDLLSFGILISE